MQHHIVTRMVIATAVSFAIACAVFALVVR